MGMIENLEKMLASGRDDALLRYGLGDAYSKDGNYEKAVKHLAHAVDHDPAYSAAWKAYGKALAELGRRDEAIAAYDRGIVVAEEKGDVQAAKEMKVFRKRLQKRASA